jgi:hypothetical protein
MFTVEAYIPARYPDRWGLYHLFPGIAIKLLFARDAMPCPYPLKTKLDMYDEFQFGTNTTLTSRPAEIAVSGT